MDTRPLGSAEGLVAGRYRLDGQAGSGGVALVFRAVDTRLGRTVALKKLKDESRRTPTFEERFEREARLMGAVRHPSCAQVLDFGWDEAGTPFLVMEWIDGVSLFDEVRRCGPLAPARARHLFGQLCDALAAVHASGVVHRDIKPENVMVVRDRDGSEAVKLVDFGIARSLAKDAPGLTQTNMRIGSPEYMAPEHILGEACDERSDVYCAAALLFFLLAGRPPFAGGPQQLLTQHLSAPVPSLPSSLRRFQPVVERGMAKNRDDRYISARELKEALDVVGTPPPRAIRRSRVVAAAMAITLLAVGVSLAATKAIADEPGAPSAPARLSWAEAEAKGRGEALARGYEVKAAEVRGAKDGFRVVLDVTKGGRREALVAVVDPFTGKAALEKLSSRR